MNIKKINELFDDPTMRDALEIPHIKGDLDMVDGNWRKHNIIKKDNELHLLNLVLFRYPVLRLFHFVEREIDKIKMFSFFASTKKSEIETKKQDLEYFCQLSIATNKNSGNYHIILLYSLLEDLDSKDYITNDYEFEDIEHVYDVIDGYLKICEKYGIIDKKDLQKNTTSLN